MEMAENVGEASYVTTWILLQVAEARDVDLEGTGDFVGVCQNGVDVVIGAHFFDLS